jgi:hypothetical protein
LGAGVAHEDWLMDVHARAGLGHPLGGGTCHAGALCLYLRKDLHRCAE